MIDIEYYVKQNSAVQSFVKDHTPGHLDKYIGTLDYATARFNTILLRLSQEPLLLDEYSTKVYECFEAIQSFYKNTRRLDAWPKVFHPFIKVMLYGIGMRRIPKIKKLLEEINN